jgi:hypothetical protein
MWKKQKINSQASLRGYVRSLLIICQVNFVMARAIHWVDSKYSFKIRDVKKLKLFDIIWMSIEISMSTLKGGITGHTTIMRQYNVRFDERPETNLFTVWQLEKGL